MCRSFRIPFPGPAKHCSDSNHRGGRGHQMRCFLVLFQRGSRTPFVPTRCFFSAIQKPLSPIRSTRRVIQAQAAAILMLMLMLVAGAGSRSTCAARTTRSATSSPPSSSRSSPGEGEGECECECWPGGDLGLDLFIVCGPARTTRLGVYCSSTG